MKKEANKEIQMEIHYVQVPTPGIPYPQKLKKGKLEKQFVKFLGIFKTLHINIPFMDELENIPSYVKFMKKILENKKNFGEYETILLTKECSAILQKKLQHKLQVRVVLLYHSLLGTHYLVKLCDLGESINLMPLSMFKRLNWGNQNRI